MNGFQLTASLPRRLDTLRLRKFCIRSVVSRIIDSKFLVVIEVEYFRALIE